MKIKSTLTMLLILIGSCLHAQTPPPTVPVGIRSTSLADISVELMTEIVDDIVENGIRERIQDAISEYRQIENSINNAPGAVNLNDMGEGAAENAKKLWPTCKPGS